MDEWTFFDSAQPACEESVCVRVCECVWVCDRRSSGWKTKMKESASGLWLCDPSVGGATLKFLLLSGGRPRWPSVASTFRARAPLRRRSLYQSFTISKAMKLSTRMCNMCKAVCCPCSTGFTSVHHNPPLFTPTIWGSDSWQNWGEIEDAQLQQLLALLLYWSPFYWFLIVEDPFFLYFTQNQVTIYDH